MEEDGPEDSLGLPEIRIRKRVEKKATELNQKKASWVCVLFSLPIVFQWVEGMLNSLHTLSHLISIKLNVQGRHN